MATQREIARALRTYTASQQELIELLRSLQTDQCAAALATPIDQDTTESDSVRATPLFEAVPVETDGQTLETPANAEDVAVPTLIFSRAGASSSREPSDIVYPLTRRDYNYFLDLDRSIADLAEG